jgi:hypothetical protein
MTPSPKMDKTENKAGMDEILIGSRLADFVALHPDRDRSGEFIYTEVEVRCQGFSARTGGPFFAEGFSKLAGELDEILRTLKGSARAATLEEQLDMTFTGDGRGHVTVEGVAVSDPARTARLSFKFEIDQTYLPDVVAALRKVQVR